jgi:hypothetical protein
MNQMRKKAFTNRLLIVTMLCACFVLALALQANADAEPPSGGQQDKQLKEAKVTLQRKSSEMVSTFSGDQYNIDSTTIVMNENGEQIKIEYLLVPCEAELVVETKTSGNPFAHSIRVIRTHQKATNRMHDLPR